MWTLSLRSTTKVVMVVLRVGVSMEVGVGALTIREEVLLKEVEEVILSMEVVNEVAEAEVVSTEVRRDSSRKVKKMPF